MSVTKIFYTTREVAVMIGFSDRQIRLFSTESHPPRIPYCRIGRSVRFLKSEIGEWVRQVALRGTVDDHELEVITNDLIEQRLGPCNGAQNERSASSSLCQSDPEAPVSQKVRGSNTITRLQTYAEADAGGPVA